MFSVSLSNQDCIFDSAFGFATSKEAMAWALGRGGKYVAQISNDDVEGSFRSFSVSNDCISTFDGWDWIDLALDDIEKYI